MRCASFRHSFRLKIDLEKYRLRSKIVGSVLRISSCGGAVIMRLAQNDNFGIKNKRTLI